MYQQYYEKLIHIINENQIKINEPMKVHTTFKTGGPVDILVQPYNQKELSGILRICNDSKIPYYVIGNGSNLLVGDYGYHGMMIEMKYGFSDVITINRKDGSGMIVQAGAGIVLSKLAKILAEHSLTGFEFASGIPGTLGGAVVMNAGAYGSEMQDVILKVKTIGKDGRTVEFGREEMKMGYRNSILLESEYIVTEVWFQLQYGKQQDIYNKMKELNSKRREKQPLDYPSAGSTFKRPEGYFAGKLIMDAGLKGFRIGDMMVSEKHCGFVVNAGNGTAAQAKELIEKIIEKVQENSGVLLEPEVRFIGEFEPDQEKEVEKK